MSLDYNDFSNARKLRSLNIWLTSSLSIILIIGMNLLGMYYFKRYDVRSNRSYALSAESLAYLKQLRNPIQIIVTFTPDPSEPHTATIFRDIRNLLREVEYASRHSDTASLQIEWVNVYEHKKRTESLVAQYGLSQEQSILVVCEDKFKAIPATTLYTADQGELKAFNGEQELFSAILDVTESKRKKIYFTSGHGEMTPSSIHPARGLSELTHLLKLQNYDCATLDITETSTIPEDADLVIVAGPMVPWLNYESQQLLEYLSQRSGRVIVLLSPMQSSGLEDCLYAWGILSDDKVIVDLSEDFQSASGDFLVRRFVPHPIVKRLVNYQLGAVMGLMRPVRPDPGAPHTPGLSVQTLIASSDKSFAKYANKQTTHWDYDPAQDLTGPVSVATVAEKKADSLPGLNLAAGRLIVFGNASFIANHKLNCLGNRILILDTIHWAVDRNTLLNIPPKPIPSIHLVFSKNELSYVGLKMLILPAAITATGCLVYGLRNRRHSKDIH